jgi:methyltransferase (TIGR00027 family)
LTFIAIDFEKESLPQKLDKAGFLKNKRSLFILEGVLMYLTAEAVAETLKVIRDYAGGDSRLVFDYVRDSVMRGNEKLYGEKEITRSVSGWAEKWLFGLDPAHVGSFLSAYGFQIADAQDAARLETKYFQNGSGRLIGRINQTHCLATAGLRP